MTTIAMPIRCRAVALWPGGHFAPLSENTIRLWDRWWTAVHEAGHAVLAARLGIRVISVTIGSRCGPVGAVRTRTGTRLQLGVCNVKRSRDHIAGFQGRPIERDAAERHVMLLLAGRLAEEVVLGAVRDSARIAYDGDRRNIEMLRASLGRTPRESAERVRELSERVADNLSGPWRPALEAVAVGVFNGLTLTGGEVATLVSEARPGSAEMPALVDPGNIYPTPHGWSGHPGRVLVDFQYQAEDGRWVFADSIIDPSVPESERRAMPSRGLAAPR